MKLYKNDIIVYLAIIACLFSNISQIPYFVEHGLTQLISFPMWLILFVTLLCFGKIEFKKTYLAFLTPFIIFVLSVLINSFFSRNDYFSSSLLYSFLISVFILFIGCFCGKYINDEALRKISFIYIISTFIVSIFIFIQFFGFDYNLDSSLYAYSSKNSISQIISTSIILLICVYKSKKKIMNFAKVFLIAFEILVLLYLRSRATIICLLIVFLLMIFLSNTNKKIKIIICSVFLIGICLIALNPTINEFVFDKILFAGRDSSNLDSLSSGRLTIIMSFPDLIKDNWFFGIGSKYYECFPLSAVLQFGLFTGLLLNYFSLIPLFYSYKMKNEKYYFYILFLISVSYVIDGLFEGLTPFGPGIKCYFLWFLFGILLANNVKKGNLDVKY